MRKPFPLVLYSTNSRLAHFIADQFYGGFHYVWCNRYFDHRSIPPHAPLPAPSSSPGHIYQSFLRDIQGKDLHSSLINQNRIGLYKGADAKKNSKVITQSEKRDIMDMIQCSSLDDFQPLIYVIPCTLDIRKIVQLVPHTGRANPLYEEYIIANLHRDQFDVINPHP